MKILLAVSGGIDSMTMADMCVSHCHLISEVIPSDAVFAVAHCNFHLRPGECDGDEDLVREWAENAGLPFYKADFDTLKYAAENGVSVEMAARDLRYGWFFSLMEKEGFDALAVAHNANDNAETLILNLLRGTGLRGITGMASGGRVLRPLLGLSRRTIENYAAVRGVKFRTDSTNLENEYKRNKIRNLVFPVFSEINPSFIETLGEDMKHFREAAAVLDGWYAGRRAEVLSAKSADGDFIDVPKLLAEKDWEYLLYRIMEEHGFNSSAVSSLAGLLKDGERTFSGKTFSGTSHKAVTASGKILLIPLSVDETPSYKVEEIDYSPDLCLKCAPGTIMVDAEKLPAGYVVRPWRAGDWFIPYGMKGKKKVSDLFTDLHIDVGTKASRLVLAPDDTSSRVLAVLGLRIDDSVKVTPSTRRILKFTI